MIRETDPVEILARLISYRTEETNVDASHECGEYIASLLASFGCSVSSSNVERSGDDRPIVVGRFSEGDSDDSRIHTFHFNGHYDVVPAGEGWATDPYDAVVRDGRVFGRGASDMKGGVAAILSAIGSVATTDPSLLRGISVSFVPDEEKGGAHGTGRVVKKWPWDDFPSCVVIPEATHPSPMHAHHGVVQYIATMNGKRAHPANPGLGNNAFHEGIAEAADLLRWFERYRQDYMQKHGPCEPTMVPELTLGGIAQSDSVVNVVPERFSFSVDRRLRIGEDVGAQVRELERAFHARRFQLETLNVVEPCRSALSPETACMRIVEIAEELFGDAGKSRTMDGFCDLHYFVNDLDVTGIAWGPGDPAQAHTTDESIDIATLKMYRDAYIRLIIES